MSRRFRFAHLVLESDDDLRELPAVTDAAGPPDLVLVHEPGTIDWERASRSLFESPPPAGDGDPELELDIRRRDDGWLFTFGALARFHLSEDRSTLVCSAAADTPPQSARHVLLDQVLPYVVALDGDLVLHASAVTVGAAGIAFVGESGMGKSTLATSLGQDGHGILTDDCAVVHWVDGTPVIEPSYPGLRLWPESADHLLVDDDGGERAPMAHYTPKVRAVPEGLRFVEEGAPLRGVLAIDHAPDDDPGLVAVTPLRPGEAAFAMVESAFVLADGADDRAAIFDRFTRLAAAVPAARITVPDDFARLPAVRRAVTDWARDLSASPSD